MAAINWCWIFSWCEQPTEYPFAYYHCALFLAITQEYVMVFPDRASLGQILHALQHLVYHTTRSPFLGPALCQ